MVCTRAHEVGRHTAQPVPLFVGVCAPAHVVTGELAREPALTRHAVPSSISTKRERAEVHMSKWRLAILGALVLVAGASAILLLPRGTPVVPGDGSWVPIWVAWDPETVQHNEMSYPLAAGFVGESSPHVTLDAPWRTSQALLATGRTPATAVARDTFAFATDDGTTGRVIAVDMGDGGALTTVLETQHVVSQVALTPDVTTTFALLLDRGSLAPLGVWMVKGHDGQPRRVMGPPVPLVGRPGFHLVARSMVGDALLTDGEWLVRESCIDSGLACAVEAINLTSGASVQLPRTNFARGPQLQLVNGVLAYQGCPDLTCPELAMVLATGDVQNLPGVGQGGYLAAFDNRVLYIFGADVDANLSARRLDVYDVMTDESQFLWAAPEGRSVFAWPMPNMSRIDGTITVGVGDGGGGGARFELLDLASLQIRDIPQPRYPWAD